MPNSQTNGAAQQTRIRCRPCAVSARTAGRHRSSPRLRKMPSGPLGNSLPHAHEILALVLEVEVVGEAVRQPVVGGGVAEEAVDDALAKSTDSAQASKHDANRRRGAGAEAPRQAPSGADALATPWYRCHRSVVRKLRSACRIRRSAPWSRRERLVQQHVEPLHLADEGGDVVARAGLARLGAELRRQRPAVRSGRQIAARQRRGVALRHDQRIASVGRGCRAGRRRRSRRSACPSPAPRTRSAACLPTATGRRRGRAPTAPRRRRA